MKNIISKIHLSLVPLALASLFTLLFSQCNADRPDLPKEYNILQFKVDGEQVINATECGEWLSGCDPLECQHSLTTGSTVFDGGEKNKPRIYIYIFKKFKLNDPIDIDENDRLDVLIDRVNGSYEDYSILVNHRFIFLERNLEEGWIEGEFDFTVSNNEGDTGEITDGYFKLTIDVY